MPKLLVAGALFWNLLQIAIISLPFLLNPLIYFGVGRPKDRDFLGGMLILGFICCFSMVMGICYKSPLLHDYIRYLQDGDAYTQETICQVDGAVQGGLLGEQVRWHCADGREFMHNGLSDLNRLVWGWVQARQRLQTRYLPRTGLILEAIPIDPVCP